MHLKEWDKILSSGQQCFGFCNPDGFPESDKLIRNILLVDELNEEEAMKAYKKGRFFGSTKNSGLLYEKIESQKNAVNVKINKEGQITFITNTGRYSFRGREIKFDLTPDIQYVRIEAKDNTGNVIFSQPIFYK